MTLDFPVLLRLVDERSTAFRAAVASAPTLDMQVPTCPGWTLSRPARCPPAQAARSRTRPTPSARGAASDLVLAFYGRIPVDSLELDGDRRLFDLLIAWQPDE
jgi:hypothetical protein